MKLIIVTGISRGLGKSLLNYLIDGNHTVVGLSRSGDLDKFNEMGNFKFYQTDLSNKESIDDLLSNIESDFLPFKEITFINNAGVIGPIGKANGLMENKLRENIEINLLAPILIASHLSKHSEKLNVVNISSGAANRPIPGWGAYCASKAAVKMFFEVMELDSELSLLTIDPGVMDTDMQSEIRSSNKSAFPLIEDFRNLKKEGLLKDSNEVAKEIINSMRIKGFV